MLLPAAPPADPSSADLIQVNALIPALLAGNTVLLKPSPQTPLCSERILASLLASGLPENVCQVLHLTPSQMDHVVAHPAVKFVSFTGSVENGKRVDATAAQAGTFKSVGLELGGKDAAYVRAGESVLSSRGRVEKLTLVPANRLRPRLRG